MVSGDNLFARCDVQEILLIGGKKEEEGGITGLFFTYSDKGLESPEQVARLFGEAESRLSMFGYRKLFVDLQMEVKGRLGGFRGSQVDFLSSMESDRSAVYSIDNSLDSSDIERKLEGTGTSELSSAIEVNSDASALTLQSLNFDEASSCV